MSETKGNTAAHGDVDRVQMVSLEADGRPRQTPGFEIIGDKDAALQAAKEQFAVQAVSGVDQAERAKIAAQDDVDQSVQDPQIAELTEKHEAAAKAGEAAAEAMVNAAYTDDRALQGNTAASTSSSTSTSKSSTSSK